MGNVRCKNCSEEFSSKEKYCPECGEKRPAGGKRVRKGKNAAGKIIAAAVLIVLVVIVVILLVRVLGNGKPEKIPDQTQPGVSDQGGTPDNPGNGENPEPSGTLVLESVALDKTEVTLRDGDNTVQLHTTAYPEGVDAKIQWASNAPAVATVDQTGLVTAVSEGTAEIYAYCEDKIAVCMVYSYVTGSGVPSGGGTTGGTDSGAKAGKLVVTSIYSSNPVSDITLKSGENVQLYLSNDGAKVSDGMTWTSDSAGVSVDDTGYVTANYSLSGYATLTVSYGGSTAEVIVRVR